MLEADLIYCDPPWNTSMVNGYYTKAHMPDIRSNFKDLISTFFSRIRQINPKACYIEIGKQGVQRVADMLKDIYPVVEVFDTFYYKTKPCHLVRGGYDRAKFSFNGLDEAPMVRGILESEAFGCIADICMGRGLTGTEAFKAGKRFVGTELNKRRLACCIERVAALGGDWGELK